MELKHWNNEASVPLTRCDIIQKFSHIYNAGLFTFHEFEEALRLAKINKQPGPDNIPMELFKWMDATNRSWFLGLVNRWWAEKHAPDDVFLARVVPIYKKGDTDNPANYRPISLLNSIYKVYST